MDPNKANVGTFYLTIPILILTAVGVLLMAWGQLSQQTAAQASPVGQGGASMIRGWLPILFVTGGLVLSIVLQIFLGLRLRKNKTLRQELANLKSDLGSAQRARQTCVENYQTVEHERDIILGQLSEVTRDFGRAKENYDLEVLTERMALRAKEAELKETTESAKQAHKRANAAETENLRLADELAQATPNKRLVTIAKNDTTDIQNAVIVLGVQFRNEIENYKRYVDFGFAIFNQSVYDISIDDKLGDGDIIFNQHPLVGVKKIEENKAHNIQPRSPGSFTVRQYLDSGDIDAIKRATADRRFDFQNLRIKIKGGSDSEGIVQEKKLQFEGSLSKEYPTWFNYTGPFRSRFNAPISGRINLAYFHRELDLHNTVPLKDDRYIFYFILHTYIANHGAPTGIDRFRLVLKANEETYEGTRLPLTGCRWIRPGAEEELSERDIESENDVTLTDVRRGWMQFAVRGVKDVKEESTLEIALDIIDKNEDVNRLASMSHEKWIEDSLKQESYINGPAIWQKF